jgi:hypothetical protein
MSQMKPLVQQQSNIESAPGSPAKLGSITRRKSVMAIGFNLNPSKVDQVAAPQIAPMVKNQQNEEEAAEIGLVCQQGAAPNYI